MLRVGIISAAWGVKAHLPAWRALDGVEAVAICTSRQETADAAAAAHGFRKAYGDYRAMAADPEIDIIDVGTRPHLRFDMVMRALTGGKHVYAGIPFGDTLEHAREMTRLQQNKRLVGVVDAYSQFTPAIAYMRELVDQGYIGEPWGFSCRFHLQLFAEGQVNVPNYVWFADKAHGTSVLRNLGSHALNALVAILGPARAVVASADRKLALWRLPDGRVLHPEVADHASLLLRLANGVTGPVDLVWAGGDGNGFRLAVHGSNGRLEVRSPHFPDPFAAQLFGSQSRGYLDQAATPLDIPERFARVSGVALDASALPASLPMAIAMRRMCDEIKDLSTPAAPDFTQALHVQAIIDAAERSNANGAWVDVDSDA